MSSGVPADIIRPIILSANKNPATAIRAKNTNAQVKKVLYSLFTSSPGLSSAPTSFEKTATAAL